jgi:hypothetical protein
VFVTSEGHPGARLQRALAAGNIVAAEQAAFDVPFVPLTEARALVELYAEKGDRKFERAALKYLAGTAFEPLSQLAKRSLRRVVQEAPHPRLTQPYGTGCSSVPTAGYASQNTSQAERFEWCQCMFRLQLDPAGRPGPVRAGGTLRDDTF